MVLDDDAAAEDALPAERCGACVGVGGRGGGGGIVRGVGGGGGGGSVSVSVVGGAHLGLVF